MRIYAHVYLCLSIVPCSPPHPRCFHPRSRTLSPVHRGPGLAGLHQSEPEDGQQRSLRHRTVLQRAMRTALGTTSARSGRAGRGSVAPDGDGGVWAYGVCGQVVKTPGMGATLPFMCLNRGIGMFIHVCHSELLRPGKKPLRCRLHCFWSSIVRGH